MPHALTGSEMPAHAHTSNNIGRSAGFSTLSQGGSVDTFVKANVQTTLAGGGQAHSHGIATDGAHVHVVGTEPYYYALQFIMYVGVSE